MQGIINFDGTLSGSIAGGGGGGSEVTITPVLTEGTKIADYSIDGNTGELYAPEAGDTVDVIPTLNVGDKVADIEVNGVNKALYSRSYGYANDMHDTNSETIGGFQKGSDITPIMVKAVSYADQTGADGETVGVLSVGDTDYDVKQKKSNTINYSTTEQNTGMKWVDGKTIYRKVFVFENVSAGDHNFDTNILNVDEVINQYGTFIRQTTDFTWTYSLNSVNEVSNTDSRFVVLARYKNTENKIYVYVAPGVYDPITKLTFIMEYTKNEV